MPEDIKIKKSDVYSSTGFRYLSKKEQDEAIKLAEEIFKTTLREYIETAYFPSFEDNDNPEGLIFIIRKQDYFLRELCKRFALRKAAVSKLNDKMHQQNLKRYNNSEYNM